MALHKLTLELLARVTAELGVSPTSRRPAAMFSQHDVLATPATLKYLFGDAAAGLKYRCDSPGILKWHNAAKWLDGVVDTYELFEAIGWDLTTFDLVAARGGETIKDLNEPFSPAYRGTYSFLYDNVAGQVFMAGQCLRSAVELVCQGGYLLSVSAANMPNHGFYSLSPTVYADTLTQNGFEIVHQDVVVGIVRDPKSVPFLQTFGCALPHGAANVVLARRVACAPFVYPTQSKFKRHPNSTL